MSFFKPQSKKELTITAVVGVAIMFAIILALGFLVGAANEHEHDQVKVVVTYDGSWSGAYTDVETMQSWSHDGSYSVTLDRPDMDTWIVSANAQKADGGDGVLTISIQDMDGHVLKTASTSTAYGMAQVTMTID